MGYFNAIVLVSTYNYKVHIIIKRNNKIILMYNSIVL